jgi:molybdopterin converting factor small subunit
MKVRVAFFSQLIEVAGLAAVELEIKDGAIVEDLLELLYLRTPRLRDWNGSILVGAGLEFVGRDHVLRPAEEVSIMPPVQGG